MGKANDLGLITISKRNDGWNKNKNKNRRNKMENNTKIELYLIKVHKIFLKLKFFYKNIFKIKNNNNYCL
jgi:hypothetical protein